MFKILRAIFFCNAFLCIQTVRGDNPLQSLLSTLECYKSDQEGCDTDLTVAYPNVSRSWDNSTEAATRFYLFTNENVEDPELIHKCGGKLPPNTNFNPKCKTFFVFPGFVSGACHMSIYRELIYERFKCGCYNYIHIEWTWGNSFDLMTAVRNMPIVADQVAIVMQNLQNEYGLTSSDFICMGQSLGSHGCGLVGQRIDIDVIHGTDPAGGPYYESMPEDERLDASDAKKCVHVMHTNAGQCIPFYFGENFTCGTKDFWFNDGLHQFSCYPDMFNSFLKGDILYALVALLPAGCNHLQSLFYYKASMCPGKDQSDKFIGVECKSYEDAKAGKCNDCGRDGEKCDVAGAYSCDCNDGKHKDYYVETGLFCPYFDNSRIKNIRRLKCPAAIM